MSSSGTYASDGSGKRFIHVLPFAACYTLLFVLTCRNPFLLDKDILFSKIAYWLNNGDGTFGSQQTAGIGMDVSTKVSAGDVIFLPAGRIHALGPGIVLAEIQQTSDMTYRIYDWDRVGQDGKPRELHIEHALNVLDYKAKASYLTSYQSVKNSPVNLVKCPYFSTRLIEIDEKMDMDYATLDSFVIYMCLEGGLDLRYDGENRTQLVRGDTILIPASLKVLSLIPDQDSRLLEIYV